MSILDDNYEETLTPEWLEKAAAEEAFRKLDWTLLNYCGTDSTLPDPDRIDLYPGSVFNLIKEGAFELYVLLEIDDKKVWHRVSIAEVARCTW